MERALLHQKTSSHSTNRPFFSRTPDIGSKAAFFPDYRSGAVQRQAESSPQSEEMEEEPAIQEKPLESTVQRMCAECEKEPKEGSALQPKLNVGQAGDPYEQEADRVADQVADHLQASKAPSIQTRLESAPPRITPFVMRQGEGSVTASPRVEQGIQNTRGAGEAITHPVRGAMEQALGADFSGVRIHASSEADSLNRSLNARAFTTGKDIYFKGGEYQPESPAGQKLLAHELAHVLQQGAAPNIQRGSMLENGEQTSQGHDLHIGTVRPDHLVQLWPGDGMAPPGDCGWADYLVLRGSVETAKAVVNMLGACSAGDNCLTLAIKIAAITAEIAARVGLDTTCFRGGDGGHRQQVQDKINMVNRCYQFFSNSNCPPELITAMAVVVERAREVIAAAAIVVAVALIVALVVAIIALIEVIAALIAEAAAAIAGSAIILEAAEALMALLVLLRSQFALAGG